ncbi:MAG: AraC family ligand binding domain-containing protein [Rubrobacter sp.]|nr:AraC family ligand binding domain-containing protein [Rubrobacter sp.]
MATEMKRAATESSGREEIEAKFREEGLSPHAWGNEPDYEYEWHSHDYHKVLYCVTGSIVFHTEDGDFDLEAGDRLDVEPGTGHSATVGSDGVQCMEAAR